MADYNHSVASLGQTFFTGASLAGVGLWGAHHRILTDYETKGARCAWVTGDYATKNAVGRDQGLGEAGVCTDAGPFRLGIGVGADAISEDMAFGGNSRYTGQHFVGEVDFKVPDSKFVASVTGYYGSWNADIKRNYLNGVAIDTSRGETDARSWAVRSRVDWVEGFKLAGLSFSPYAAYTYGGSTVDAYTETGGGFPAAIDKYSDTSSEVRIGTTAAKAITTSTTVRVGGEWVHRFDSRRSAVTGQIIGVGALNVAGHEVAQDWGRVSLDVDQKLTESALVSLSVSHTVGRAEDASLTTSLSLRMGF